MATVTLHDICVLKVLVLRREYTVPDSRLCLNFTCDPLGHFDGLVERIEYMNAVRIQLTDNVWPFWAVYFWEILEFC